MNTERDEELGGSHPGEPLPITVPKLRNPSYKIEGCQHTTDPNGFLVDAEDKPTGRRCACWETD